MNVLKNALIVGLAALLPSLPIAAADLTDEPLLIVDTQYSAVFEQSRGTWLLIPPAAGVVMQQDGGHCRDDRPIAPGLWLIMRDALGRVELVAPSVTPLPAGHPDRITLLSCDSVESGGLHLPKQLIETLARDHGAVRING